MSPFHVPPAVMSDSYKTTHPFIYPPCKQMVAYGEFRQGYDKDSSDTRVLTYGMRYIIENYISKKWTMKDLAQTTAFMATHNAGFTSFPFPKELFEKIVNEHGGYFPIRIEALPEATVCHIHTPVYQMITSDEMAPLVTYLETLLTMVWYPSTVATLSRRVKDQIQKAYEQSVDQDGFWSLESRLHDFGFRACTSVEQSIIGGTAHLLNFTGSDTMSAAFYAQFHLNQGRPVASSIPASEHSVMTSFKTEEEAMERMMQEFGQGVYACVMDSYDYQNALDNVLPNVATMKLKQGGFLVLRPDSGDLVDSVLMGLRAAEKVFGCDINQKGFKVLRGCGVIQGDGVSYKTLAQILDAVLAAGFSAQNVAFGMGGGLLQKLNRDTMSMATKLSHVTYNDLTTRHVMKHPKSDADKISLPGIFDVVKNEQGIPIVYPRHANGIPREGNLLQVVYDHGPVLRTGNDEEDKEMDGSKFATGLAWENFDVLKARATKEWELLPRTFDNISPELREVIKTTLAIQNELHKPKSA